MSECQIVDVLVVGAGPVGLFLANELHRQDLSCRIIDKKSTLSTHSKALGLHARSLEVFIDTGYINAVLQQGLQVEKLHLSSNNKTLATISFENIDAPYQCIVMLPQDKTECIFHHKLTENNLDVDWQHELLSFEQDSEKTTAQIKLPSGETQTQTAKWIVGCDGAHSTVRHTLGFGFMGAPYQEHWWLVDCHVQWRKPRNEVFSFLTKAGPLIFFPIGEGRYRLIMMADQTINGDPSFDQVKKHVAELCNETLTLLDPIWISAFTIHHRQVSQYQDHRAFLAGDAAHIHSPAGGQGLNTGIQDAYNLAWKLALVKKDKAPATLLESYNIERYAVGKEVVKTTDRMTKAIMLKNPVAIAIRNRMISILTSIKSFRKKFTSQMAELSINYRKSPIVKQHGNFYNIKAGDLVPNMPLYDVRGYEHNIFTVLDGRKFSLLFYAGDGQQAEVAEGLNQFLQIYPDLINCHCIFTQKPGDFHWSGNLWIDKDATKQGVLMIRPDQYVGFVSDKLDFDRLSEFCQLMLLSDA